MKVELKLKEFKENTFDIIVGDIYKGEIIIDEAEGTICVDIFHLPGQDYQITEHKGDI